jgi:hypothetical protein
MCYKFSQVGHRGAQPPCPGGCGEPGVSLSGGLGVAPLEKKFIYILVSCPFLDGFSTHGFSLMVFYF